VLARNAFGAPTQVADTHGVVSEIRYDSFGREYQRQDDTGAWRWEGPQSCESINCPDGARYRIEERVAGGGRSYTYYDILQRPIRTSTVGFDGDLIHKDTEYDYLGRVKRVSNPYRDGDTVYWTESRYDIMGRTTKLIQADGTTGQTVSYNGWEKTITNALGHSKVETRNAQGELVKVKDNLGGTIEYSYDAYGNLLSATTDAPDTTPVTVRMCYDELDRKVAMHDPDKGGFAGNADMRCSSIKSANPPSGWWTYQYNALGELREQRDTKGQRRVMTYDALGRQKTRTDYQANDGDPDNERVEAHTRWHYDGNLSNSSDPGELGNLTYVIQSFGRISEECIPGNYCQILAYDRLGRPSGTFTFHPDNEDTGYVSDTGYMTSVQYDSIGRPYVEQDSMQGLVGTRSGIHRRYNAYGYVTDIIDLASGDVLQQVLSRDAWGNIIQEKRDNGYTTTYWYDEHFGRLTRQRAANGGGGEFPIQDIRYDWDAVGNLNWRHNENVNKDNGGTTETFCYDGLNRLINARRGPEVQDCIGFSEQDIRYDGRGNITYKHDVGTYDYGSNAGPHAVTRAGDDHYTYDANGNQVSGAGRTLKYNSHDKPIKISNDDHITRFEYGPDRSRFRRTDESVQNGVSVIKTTTYLGNVERIESSNSNTITWRRTVAGTVYITETSRYYQRQGETEVHFLYQDHLGSTDVITDRLGNIVQSMSFDAWGQRRDAVTWDPVTDVVKQSFNTRRTNQGFTGHEQVDELGLIHMNGRVYDPKLGRFLQADPFIQSPGNTQSYNRYSYLWNNPLNATDPSGYFLKKLWDDIRPFVGVIVGAMLAAWCPFCTAHIWGMAFAGAVTGAAAAAANGGDILRGALTGAVSAAVFAGIGSAFDQAGRVGGVGHVSAHATAGGVLSVLQGGKFGHGFVSAGLTKAANVNRIMAGDTAPNAVATRVLAAGLLGGTLSEATGGKFKNGAATAAFTWALSQGAQRASNARNRGGESSGNSCTVPLECASAQDQTAAEALSVANPKSIKDNLEYGGYIYRTEDGTYGYTSPLAGTETGFSPSSAAGLVPEGAVIVGDYHTHGDYSIVDSNGRIVRTGDPTRDHFNSDNFSTGDYRGIKADAGGNRAYRGYLGTPSGVFKAYDPVGNREYIINP
jgi:RHS repeat-associated protein